MAGVLGRDVDGVLLDIDDTLVDTRASFDAGMRAVAREYLPHLGDEGPRAALEHWLTDRAGHFDQYAAGHVDYLTQRRLRADALLDELGGAPLDGESFLRWNAVYERAFAAAWVALPGAVELVSGLAAAGVPMGAVTNHETAQQREKLAGCGLGALPVLTGIDTLGVGKPDARVFRHACDALGLDPARTVYAGNDLQVDALGARDAGLVAVWVDHGRDHRGRPVNEEAERRAERDGVHVLRTLDALAAWLGVPADLGSGTADR